MSTDDLALLDATAQAELVRTKQASPAELVDAAIARIEALNPTLNAVIHERFDKARDAARGTLPDGPFRGVPVLFKDLMCAVEGDPYHEGSNLLKRHGFRATHTDHLAQRYLEAGFVYLGRTNTPEFGLVPTTEPDAYGAARNPWNVERTTGGSSGGSGAAVASGMVPVAHANDGGGSIRIPASCNGLVGLKPSRGRTSPGPAAGHLSGPLIVELAVTRTVRDAAALLDALGQPFPGQTVVAPSPRRPFAEELGVAPGALRIGMLTHNPLGIGDVDPQVVRETEAAGRLLETLGHSVQLDYPKQIEDPALLGHFTALWNVSLVDTITRFERAVGGPAGPGDLEPLTIALADDGRTVSAQTLLDAVHAMEEVAFAAGPWWESYDLLLTPTLAEPPVPLGTFVDDDTPVLGFMRAAAFAPFCAPFNITGQPAISLPLGTSDDGLPIGVHLVAAYGREDLLVRVASQIEQAAPWADRLPTIHA
ncbi:MAG TPA: amidase family protein [Acidimicrobiia bacterium]|jgi:amidase